MTAVADLGTAALTSYSKGTAAAAALAPESTAFEAEE